MPSDLTRGQRIIVTIGVMLAMLLAALDQTIVGTALPRIVSELQGLDFYAWVATSYLVASTTMTPIAGKLGDLFGRKPMFLIGMVGFVLASALCGQAQDMVELVAVRGLQGLFAGVLMSTAFASIGELYTPMQRARVQGAFGGVFGLASIIGPTVGGYLTDNLSWRWVFYVNLPVGILAILVILFSMPYVKSKASWRDIDFVGAFALAAGLVPLLIAFSLSSTHGWGSPEVLALFAVAAAVLVGFFFIERRTAHPVVPFELFRDRTFTVSVVTTFFVSVGMFGSILFVPIIYQGVLGVSATNSGALITPMMFGLIGASIMTGQLMTRIRYYRFLGTVGIAILLVGLWLLSQVSVTTQGIEIVRDLVIVGLGVGATMPLYINAVQSSAPRHLLGVVSSQIQLWRQLGGTIGIAVLGSVLAQQLPARIAEQVRSLDLSPAARTALAQGGGNAQSLFDPARLAAIPAPVLQAVRTALAGTIHDLFLYASVAVVFALVASVFLADVPLRGRERGRTATEASPAFGD
ncbi:MAG: MFS transporter [Chloroflexi bacterium]|nr:MFS transporter [Chloroflexota bacterium]